MANLPSSGEISLDDIIRNRTGDAGTNVSLKDESEEFASGSTVAGSSIQTTARKNLDLAPYSLSEFYNADFNTDIITGITFSISGQPGGTTTVVDGDDFTANFTTDGSETGDYDVQLKRESNNFIAGQSTVNVTSGTSHSTTFDSLNIDEATYRIVVKRGFATLSDDTTFNHFELLSGGSTAISNGSQLVDAADESVTNVELTPTVSNGVQTSTSIGTTVITGGDGDDISATNTSGTTYSIQNTPGVLRFDVIHIGNPSSARNNTTSTATLDVRYNRAINDVATFDTSNNPKTQFNSGETIRIKATSEGIDSSTDMRIGFSTSDSNTGYDNIPTDRTISDSLYVRGTETVDTLHTLTSGTSLATFFPKANYTSGDTNITAGSSFSVAPLLSYTTPGNATINVNTTQAFSISDLVGNGASVNITSENSIGDGTNSATMSPGANNKVYTISFAGSGNYLQSTSSLALLTVNPTVSMGVSPGSGDLIPTTDAHSDSVTSSTHGVTPTTFIFTPNITGNNVSSGTYSLTNFSFTVGSSSTLSEVQGKFTSGGVKACSFNISGADSTAGSTSFNQTITTITKAITAGTGAAVLRVGSSFQVTGISTNFTQNVKLQRNGSDISNPVSVSGTINFTLINVSSRDTTPQIVRLIDSDSSGTIVRNLGSYTIFGLAPIIDSFSASTGTALGTISLSWATSNTGTDVSISNNQGVSSLTALAEDGSTSQGGFSNNTSVSFTITGTNLDGEQATNTTSATTINPTLSLSNLSLGSWEYGDSGTFTIDFSKNFTDSVPLQMGIGLDTSGNGTVFQTVSVSGTSGTATFERNNFGGTSFGSVVDFRIGNSTSGRVVDDNAATFSDFSAPGQASSTSATGLSSTSIRLNWTPGSNATRQYVFRNGTQIADLDGGSFTLDVTGLSNGSTHTFRIDTRRTRTSNGVARDKDTAGSNFSGTTFNFQSVIVYGATMGVGNGQGFGTLQEDAAVGGTSNAVELFYRADIQSLGNGTQFLQSADGSDWVAVDDNKYFRIGTTHIGIIDTDGELSNYINIDNATPKAPTSLISTSITTTAIALQWTDNSGVEDDFELYRNDSGTADNGDTSLGTVDRNITEFEDTPANNATPSVSLSATANGTSQIDLSWSVSGHTSFVVTFGTGVGDYTSGGTIASSGTSANHTSLSPNTTHNYQITATKTGKTYYYAVYATNGTALSAPAQNGFTMTSLSAASQASATTAALSRTATFTATSGTDNTWTASNVASSVIKFSDRIVLNAANLQASDQIKISVSATGTLTDVTTNIAARNASLNPYQTDPTAVDTYPNTLGTGTQEQTNILSSSSRTITFSGLSAGSDTISIMLKGTADGNLNAAFSQTKTYTISAQVLDSGGSVVANSSNSYTYEEVVDPFG